MRKFDIPYNFQDDYFEEFEKLYIKQPSIVKYINTIYLPCFIKDGHNTRENRTLGILPKTWEDYIKHINLIQKYKLEICILIQKDINNIQIIDKYYDIGIRIFCINNDVLANQIKEKYNDVKLILSITREISFTEIQEQILPYDKICLPFNFNKQLHLIKQLPDTYKYSILVNSVCVYNCQDCQEHWFADYELPYRPCFDAPDNMRITIQPADLIYFDLYIDSYKLTDRTATSNFIFSTLERYINREGLPSNKEYYTINEENGNS